MLEAGYKMLELDVRWQLLKQDANASFLGDETEVTLLLTRDLIRDSS